MMMVFVIQVQKSKITMSVVNLVSKIVVTSYIYTHHMFFYITIS